VTNTKKKKPNVKQKKDDCHLKSHPDHAKEGLRLSRVKGQIEGVINMIEERRYCPDILIQVRAAKSALKAIEQSILKTHLDSCVSEALQARDEEKAKAKIEELIELIGRHK
jgi:DNA-binding FrmR family transcriptional regulator